MLEEAESCSVTADEDDDGGDELVDERVADVAAGCLVDVGDEPAAADVVAAAELTGKLIDELAFKLATDELELADKLLAVTTDELVAERVAVVADDERGPPRFRHVNK